jgi:hypothetical protein
VRSKIHDEGEQRPLLDVNTSVGSKDQLVHVKLRLVLKYVPCWGNC